MYNKKSPRLSKTSVILAIFLAGMAALAVIFSLALPGKKQGPSDSISKKVVTEIQSISKALQGNQLKEISYTKIANKFLINELKKSGVNTNLFRFNTIYTNVSNISGANYITLQETYKGLPVENAEQVVCVDMNKPCLMTGSVYPEVKITTTSPKINKEEAIDLIIPDLEYPSTYEVIDSSLTILPYNEEYFLAWKIIITSDKGDYVYYVDAVTGDIITKYSQLMPSDGRGSGYRRNPFRNNLEVLTLNNPYNSGYLENRFVQVLIYNDRWTSTPGTNDSNLDFTTADLHDGMIDEVMAFYHINKAHDYFRDELGYNGVDRQLDIIVHVPQDEMRRLEPGALAFFDKYRNSNNDGQSGEIFIQDGDGIEPEDRIYDDTSRFPILRPSRESSVIYHEYTHAVVARMLPRRLYYPERESSAIDEALAFYFAATIEDDPYDVEYVEWQKQKHTHSDHNCYNPDQYPYGRNIDKPPLVYYPNDLIIMGVDFRIDRHGEIILTGWIPTHAAGSILTNAWWDVRKLIGKSLTDLIVFESIWGLVNGGTFPQSGGSLLNAAELLINRAPYGRDKKTRYINVIRDIIIGRGLFTVRDPVTRQTQQPPRPDPTCGINFQCRGFVTRYSPDIFTIDIINPGMYIVEAKWINQSINRANPLIEIYDSRIDPVVNPSWPGVFGETAPGYINHPLIPFSGKAEVINTRPDTGRFLFEVKEEGRFYIKLKSNERGEEGPATLSIINRIPEYNLGETHWEILNRKSPKIYSFGTDGDGILSISDRWIGRVGGINYCIKSPQEDTSVAGTSSNIKAEPLLTLPPSADSYIIFEPPEDISGDFTFTLFNKDLSSNQIPDLTFLNVPEIRSRISQRLRPSGLFLSYNGDIEIVNQTHTDFNTDLRQPFELSWILNGQLVDTRMINRPIRAGESVRLYQNFSSRVLPAPRGSNIELILVIDNKNIISEASERNNRLKLELAPAEVSFPPFPNPTSEPIRPVILIDLKWAESIPLPRDYGGRRRL